MASEAEDHWVWQTSPGSVQLRGPGSDGNKLEQGQGHPVRIAEITTFEGSLPDELLIWFPVAEVSGWGSAEPAAGPLGGGTWHRRGLRGLRHENKVQPWDGDEGPPGEY